MVYEKTIEILLAGILFAAAVFVILWVQRREKAKKEIRRMDREQKLEKLNGLALSSGFFYAPREDAFVLDANIWEKKYKHPAGERIQRAPGVLPVYFDYDGNTWLVMFWLGQYGVSTGGGVGIYRGDGHVSRWFCAEARFDMVCAEERPEIDFRLERRGKQLYHVKQEQWCLAAFKAGIVSKPEELRMMTTITFPKRELAQAFYSGLEKRGLPRNKFRIYRNAVYIRLDSAARKAAAVKLHRRGKLLWDAALCALYRAVTRPFCDTPDRLLFLQAQLADCFNRIIPLGENRRQRIDGHFRENRFLNIRTQEGGADGKKAGERRKK